MSNKIHIAWFNEMANEGGLARNLAFAKYLRRNDFLIINFYPRTIFERLINIFRMTFTLLTMKNKIILVHGNYFITNYLVQLFYFKGYTSLISALLKRVDKKNNLIVEINDLRYEQSLDVKSKNVTQDFVLAERKILYKLKNAKYVFASVHMKDYAIKKYNLNVNNVYSIINGGPNTEVKKQISKQENKIKYVYAGTLNRGRQIERMLDVFSKSQNVILFLIGINGEWISKEYKYENIKYLGAFKEEDAHKFTSLCDVGLIPYDQNGNYYNMCYPTKASFYITAGIPFISTELEELKYHFHNKGVCYFEKIEKWDGIVKKMNKKTIQEYKTRVNDIAAEYYWDVVLGRVNEVIVNRED